MKQTTTLAAAAFLVTSGIAQAEITANVGAASNYYFRGITQTDDAVAISGGADWAHDSGVYLGSWMSNVDFGDASPKADVEVDFFGGFANEIGDTGFGYDLGAIYYWYPGSGGDQQGGELDYAEISAGVSWNWISGSVAYTVWGETDDAPFDDGDLYYSASVEPDWEYEGFSPSAFIGYYSFDADGEDQASDFNYFHWGISITKNVGDFGAFSVNYEQVDDTNDFTNDDNPNFWIGWTKEF